MNPLSPLAKYLLALMLTYGSPGKSVLSREVIPECGHSQTQATCELEPVCEEPSVLCEAPIWSSARKGWARAETREEAMERFSRGAWAMARTATFLTRCTDERGLPIEDCKPVRWPEGPRSLASAGWSVLFWESGMREDIWAGHPPVGRGSDGEGCGMQVMPSHAADPKFSQWLVRSGIVNPRSEHASDRKIAQEDAVQMMLGTDVGSLGRCFETGLRILARKRWNATYACRTTNWSYSMFAFYGTGNKCSVAGGPLGDWAEKRDNTYRKAMSNWPNRVAMPEYAVAEYGQIDGYVAPRQDVKHGPYWDKPSRDTDVPLAVLE